MPFAIADRGEGVPGHLNRAWLLLPNGQVFHQDKYCAHAERAEPRRLAFHPRHAGQRDHLAGFAVGNTVRLDIEFTALYARLAKLDLDSSWYRRRSTCSRATTACSDARRHG